MLIIIQFTIVENACLKRVPKDLDEEKSSKN